MKEYSRGTILKLLNFLGAAMNRHLPSTAIWKALLLAVAALFLVLDLWAAYYMERQISPSRSGDLLATLATPDADYRSRIEALAPGSPLIKAGASVGDRIRFDRYGDGHRGLGVDEEVGLTIYAASGPERHVYIRPEPDPVWQTLPLTMVQMAVATSVVSTFIALFLAFLIIVRRGDDFVMCAFALQLLGYSSDYFFYALPAGSVQNFSAIVFKPLGVMCFYVSFTYFALNYPPERQLMRRPWIRRLFLLYVGIFVLVWLARTLECARVLPWAIRSMFDVLIWSTCLHVFSVVVSLAALWNSWRASQGPSRQKLAWIGLSMGLVYANYGISNLSGVLGELLPVYPFFVYQNFCLIVCMACLGYALLRHRLFDFGFAVNRALVFTIISTLLLVVFAVTEFAVDKLLHFEGRQKNIIFDALVALAVILCFHRVQHWVGHQVDHTFFHHWYEAAEKLRRFLDKAAHISEPGVLNQRFLDEMTGYSGARGGAIYVRAGGGDLHRLYGTMPEAPAVIDRNDPVVIELLHSSKPLELGGGTATLPGEIALPMLVRGKVNGLVLLSGKLTGHQYRPDELTLLAGSAQQLGLDLESLRVEDLERRATQLTQTAAVLQQQAAVLEEKLALQEREAVALRRLASIGAVTQG